MKSFLKKFNFTVLIFISVVGMWTSSSVRATENVDPGISGEDYTNDTQVNNNESYDPQDHFNFNSATDAAYSVDLVSGDLKIIQSTMNFDPLIIDMTKPFQVTSGSAEIFLDDSRGNAAGWELSVQAGNFSVTQNIGGIQETYLLSPEYFSYYVNDVNVINGQQPNQNWDINNNPIVMSSSSNLLLSARSGEGMGMYKINVNFELSIPAQIETLSNRIIGVMAGNYRGEMIYTLTSGI